MNEVEIFINRLKRIGIELELSSNYPWIYLEKVNGNQVLPEDWVNANLDEGQLYADFRFAEMADSNYLKGRFNLFYDLKPGDQYYLEWDEEK